MRKLTLHNYEEYFIDYHEGNLNGQEQKALEIFLDHFPKLKEEFDAYGALNENDLFATFSHKDTLKKSVTQIDQINKYNIDELLVAKYEGELDATLSSRLDLYIKENPEEEKRERLIKNTFIHPDISIKFKPKTKLKKHVLPLFVKKYSISISSVAAAIVILFMGIGIEKYDKVSSNSTLSNNTVFETKNEYASLPHIKRQSINLSSNMAEQLKVVEVLVESKHNITNREVEVLPDMPKVNCNFEVVDIVAHIEVKPTMPSFVIQEQLSLLAYFNKIQTDFNDTRRATIGFVVSNANQIIGRSKRINNFIEPVDNKLNELFAFEDGDAEDYH
ncbi:hypothetical protein OAO55_02855 [Bacteroidales bacterium]|nr:hypothetical protein [Bacteroidales bacterium]